MSQTWEKCSGLYDNTLYELVHCLWETLGDVYKFVRNLLMSVYWTILAITVLTIFSNGKTPIKCEITAIVEISHFARANPCETDLDADRSGPTLVRLTCKWTNQSKPVCTSLGCGPIRQSDQTMRLTWMRTNQRKPLCASLGCGPIKANPCGPRLDADQSNTCWSSSHI